MKLSGSESRSYQIIIMQIWQTFTSKKVKKTNKSSTDAQGQGCISKGCRV